MPFFTRHIHDLMWQSRGLSVSFLRTVPIHALRILNRWSRGASKWRAWVALVTADDPFDCTVISRGAPTASLVLLEGWG